VDVAGDAINAIGRIVDFSPQRYKGSSESSALKFRAHISEGVQKMPKDDQIDDLADGSAASLVSSSWI
jgi:hypothetical protein